MRVLYVHNIVTKLGSQQGLTSFTCNVFLSAVQETQHYPQSHMLSKPLNYTSKSFHKLLLCFVFQRQGFSVYPGFLEPVLQTRLSLNLCTTFVAQRASNLPSFRVLAWVAGVMSLHHGKTSSTHFLSHMHPHNTAIIRDCHHKGTPQYTHPLQSHHPPPNQSCSPPLQFFISETLSHLTPCC